MGPYPDGVIIEAKRLLQALEMYEVGIRLRRETLRREHPEASEEELERLLRAWLREVRYDLDPGMILTRDPPRLR